ncbi:MAG: hypothetical protein ACI8UO_004198 [Verrucomicrobiales bacterium]
MRARANKLKVRELISELGCLAKGPGSVFLVGGSSIVLLENGRDSTMDVDLKLDPEPAGIFEAIARLKDRLNLNIELAAPDQFIPAVPGWRERSQFIDSINSVDFYHYDFYSQALSKLERGHERDLTDVEHLISSCLIDREALLEHFESIESELIRFPSIDPEQFRRAVEAVALKP